MTTTQEHTMRAKCIKIHSSAGGEFDCYLAKPECTTLAPAVVLASAVHGVDADLIGIADEIAANGYIVAAPDLFWRTIPGPLGQDDDRTKQRSQPRLEKIKQGEMDMTDTLRYLANLPEFNGRAVAMGFCYGGPYAILGPKRLGYAAGISCHGSQMLDYIRELESVSEPVCILWGDHDHRAPPNVLDAYRGLASRKQNVEQHIFTGVEHGYMMPGTSHAFDPHAREFSMNCALKMLGDMLSSSDARRLVQFGF
jgi:carboxymethylenebutenolidase